MKVDNEGYLIAKRSADDILEKGYDEVKKHLIFACMPANNEERYKDVIKKTLGDIFLIPTLSIVSMKEGDVLGRLTLNFTSELLEELGVTEETLYSDTEKMSFESFVIKPLNSFLGDMGYNVGKTDMYIVTSKEYGAGILFGCKAIREMLHVKFGDMYYVIPASINEVLVVPGLGSPFKLQMLLKLANQEALPPEQFLSNSIFVCTNGNIKAM